MSPNHYLQRKVFDITHPDPASICIKKMAHALSLICRGNGHVMTFYSVGQHCLQCAKEAMARQLPSRLVLAALLHDATECYMSDVPRPMKATHADIPADGSQITGYHL